MDNIVRQAAVCVHIQFTFDILICVHVYAVFIEHFGQIRQRKPHLTGGHVMTVYCAPNTRCPHMHAHDFIYSRNLY